MTLLAYQQALCDLVASPELCLRVREDAQSALAQYALTARERKRLAAVVRQPGMSTSCTLHRVNRMTPIFTYLPLTCFLLGDSLIGEAQRFWAEGAPPDLQFGPETERFGRFLRQRLERRLLDDPYLGEVLAFELAVNRLRVASSRVAEDPPAPAADAGQTRIRGLHPLAALVRFDHDPLPILDALGDRCLPEPEPERGEFFLLLDARGGGIALSEIARDRVEALVASP